MGRSMPIGALAAADVARGSDGGGGGGGGGAGTGMFKVMSRIKSTRFEQSRYRRRRRRRRRRASGDAPRDRPLFPANDGMHLSFL